MKFCVILQASGNPDHQQSDDIGLPPETVFVSTLRDASEECQKYIAENNLGASNWTGGQVYDAAGIQVARISYNGRAWPLHSQTSFEIA